MKVSMMSVLIRGVSMICLSFVSIGVRKGKETCLEEEIRYA